MKEIMTVLGTLASSKLGFCQCHEHLMLSKGVSFDLNEALLLDSIAKSSSELKRYKAAGGSSVIDAQPCGCNRMPNELVCISKASGVHIIASTGFHKLCFYPKNHWIWHCTLDKLSSLYIQELTTGMYLDGETSFPSISSNYKAGIIKTAIDVEGLSPRYTVLFAAAAAAALETNCSLMIHVEQHADPLPLFHFLTAKGIAPDHLIFCHMDRACTDLKVHLQLLQEGVFLEFDTIGRFKYHSDEQEIELFNQLIHFGYIKQLLFSLDSTRTRLKAYSPDAIGLDYILTTFIPQMKACGITSEQIDFISTRNPICALT
ncbi:MAG: phosphotriesterase [Lachnospiraceae bacterium]